MNALAVLNAEDQKVYDNLLDECRDSWRKRQVFRTETEMRLSVLNDGKHPTPASKYWQAVPNTHQRDSSPKRFEHDMKSLTPGTPASDARNIIGLHTTATRIKAAIQKD